jgi:hypothetical protein
MKASRLFWIGSLIFGCSGFGQVASAPPEKSWNHTALRIGDTNYRETVGHNQPSAILKEVLDTNVLLLITRSLRIKDIDLRSVRLAPDEEGDAVLYQVLQTVDKPFESIGARLRKYVEDREDGHTEECLLSALTNRYDSISDPDFRFMAAAEPLLPVSSWKKQPLDLGVDGSRKMEFVHIDGGIAWRYRMECRANGQYEFPFSGPFREKCDPKEYDPKYRQVIQEIMNEVESEMRSQGAFKQFGAGRKFCLAVKERLKAKGIDWRSPKEFRQHRYE